MSFLMSFLGMGRESGGCKQSHVHQAKALALALAVQLLRLQQTQHFRPVQCLSEHRNACAQGINPWREGHGRLQVYDQ